MKRICEMGKHKDIRIPSEVSGRFFEKLGINKETGCLMDVKRAIFKFYNIPTSPAITIKKAVKTLAQQMPNNAYGIPITDEEIKLFMNRFGLNEDDEFTAISKRIIQSVLNS